MATGWAKDGAVQEQIDASVEDAVNRARSEMARGESLRECEECGEAIPEARRQAVPGVRHCIACREAAEAARQPAAGMNRRASKDSLLR
jgi:phage/conjugal plasmid C-4 type zinc finger TraR family protein